MIFQKMTQYMMQKKCKNKEFHNHVMDENQKNNFKYNFKIHEQFSRVYTKQFNSKLDYKYNLLSPKKETIAKIKML